MANASWAEAGGVAGNGCVVLCAMPASELGADGSSA